MSAEQEPAKKMKFPDISQVGIVVKDLDKTIAFYRDVLGLGPFVVPDLTYPVKLYHGKPVDSYWRMGFCSLGPVELEIVQPVKGPTVYDDFLQQKGEGIHHFGFDVKDIQGHLAVAKSMGIDVLQFGRRSATGGFAYLDTEKIGGVTFELTERKSRIA